jgi:hypothetical protein
MTRLHGTLAALALAALAFAAGRYSAPAMPAPRLSAAGAPALRLDVAGVRADIRQILREELRSSDREAPGAAAIAPAGAVAAPAADPPPGPEAVSAYESALALVERGRQEGRWEHSRELRALFATMTEEQRTQVIHTLLPAINAGEIAYDARSGPPF